MAISIEQYKSLQRYLDNEMNNEQEAAFKKELEADNELREYYGFEVGLRNYLDLSELKRAIPNFSVKDLIVEEHEPVTISLPTTNISLRAASKRASVINSNPVQLYKRIFYAAACFAIISGSIYVLYNNRPAIQTIAKDEVKKNDTGILKQENQSSQQEASNNKTDSDIVTKETEEENDDQQILLTLAQQYFSKDTIPNEISDTLASGSADLAQSNKPVTEDSHLPAQQTINGYDGDMSKNQDAISESKKINYYNKGIDLIELKQYKQAEKKLQWIIDNSNDENYIENAKWYLALAYLMVGDKKAALPLLSEVSTDTSAVPYNGKAKNLMKELNKK